MTTRGDPPVSDRDFKFSESGKNTLAGISDELPLADPYEGRDHLVNLDPPVTSSLRATLSGTGAYNNLLDLPRYVALDAENMSITSFADMTCLSLGGDQTVRAGSLLNFMDGGVCLESDGNKRVRSITNSVVVLGDNGVGYKVSGTQSDDSSYDLTQGELRTNGATMIDHTATSPSPIRYNFDLTELFNTDQTFMSHEPGPGSAETIVTANAIQLGQGITPGMAAGAVLFNNKAETLVINVDVLEAETVTATQSGAVTLLDTQAVFGDMTVEDGGFQIVKSHAILTGDIRTFGTGVLQTGVKTLFGNLTTSGTGGASVTTDLVVGDIDVGVGTTLYGLIGRHDGTLVVNGTFNGRRNGVPYGNHVTPFITEENLPAQATNAAYDPLLAPLALDRTFDIVVPGYYLLHIGFTGYGSVTNRQLAVGWFLDAAALDDPYVKEPKDIRDRLWPQKAIRVPLAAGQHTIQARFGKTGGNGAAMVSVKDVRFYAEWKGHM